MKQIVIVGAGPIGLEAALAAMERGFEVQIFERGQVADAVRQWGHVKMFSPFGMNSTALGYARLQDSGATLPKQHELLTGAEFRERYLLPLARSLPGDVLYEDAAVLAIGRSGLLKGDRIGEPARGSAQFRLLVHDAAGERVVKADVVLDCSGTYAQPNGLGDGGIPAPGESAARARIYYGIPDLTGKDRERFAGRRVLVVGAGHSGATAVTGLAGLGVAEIHWLLRRDRALPAEEIPNDPLPERARLAEQSNRLVKEKRITLHRAASIESMTMEKGALHVTLATTPGDVSLALDEIIAATGFRPDLALARELQGQTCWATEGTYPLAASMLGEAGGDCLNTPAFGAEMLMHPEPGYFTLGMKSYGRAPNFLLRTGHEQIETVLDWLEQKEVLTSASTA
ncbi:MAG: NAD(P)-binding domain-containing protein [Verrucomicrobiota bacterium]|nr:NAD(P)-binding domain-containing protein [Verrucomicrobiota bacterium]